MLTTLVIVFHSLLFGTEQIWKSGGIKASKHLKYFHTTERTFSVLVGVISKLAELRLK